MAGCDSHTTHSPLIELGVRIPRIRLPGSLSPEKGDDIEGNVLFRLVENVRVASRAPVSWSRLVGFRRYRVSG